MHLEPTRSDDDGPFDGGPAVTCDQCDSPNVVAMDSQGYGYCARCRGYLLGVDEGEAQASTELIEAMVSQAIKRGYVNPGDLRADVNRAITEAEGTRESTVATWNEVQEALHGLAEFSRLDGEGLRSDSPPSVDDGASGWERTALMGLRDDLDRYLVDLPGSGDVHDAFVRMRRAMDRAGRKWWT